MTRNYGIILALLALSLLLAPVRANAEEAGEQDGGDVVTEVRYVTDSSGLTGLSGDVGALSSDVSGLGDDVKVVSAEVGAVREVVEGNSGKLDALDGEVQKVGEGLDGVGAALNDMGGDVRDVGNEVRDMGETLDGVAAVLSAEPVKESVQVQDFADLMALVPEDAPSEISAYLYPTLWGVAAGVFAWFVTFMWDMVARLFSF